MEQIRKRKTIVYSIIQGIGIFAILLIGGCFDWLNLRFDFSQFKSWNYWNGVIQQVLMYSIALIIGYMGRIQKEELTNKEYEMQMNLYHTYWLQKTETFINFISSVINPRIRKEYFKSKIERKLYWQEFFHTFCDKWKLEYDKALSWCVLNQKEIQEYKVSDFVINKGGCKRYIIRRYTLELMINEAKIDNASKNFIFYPRVNPHAFTWGIRAKDKKNNNYQVANHTAFDLSVKFVRKAFSVVLFSMVFASIVFDPNKNELLEQTNGMMKLFIKYFMRVVSVVWSYILGIYMGKEVFEQNYLDVVSNRNTILEEYINWKNTQKEEETIAYKLRQSILIEKKPEVKEEEKKVNEDDALKNQVMQEVKSYFN